MSNAILITGVTGKQGRAVLQKISRSSEFELFGVTRNVNSRASSELLKRFPNLKLVTGNLDNPTAIFESVPSSIWGVFSVQAAFVSGLNPGREERQGKGLIDAAIQNGVHHFVYSSVDRHGGDSDHNPTNVPHFQSKSRIENHLAQRCDQSTTTPSPMTFTILRLPIFMENFTDNFTGRVTASIWKLGLRPTKKLQLISTADIAHWVHQAFTDVNAWRNRAISLAGDEVTFSEADDAFKAQFGYGMPRTYDLLGRALLSYGELSIMMKWFDEVGCAANIQKLRKEHPQLVHFKEWLEKSDFSKQ
jgi:uncharacterized protein YbjT (DUF2867 family)